MAHTSLVLCKQLVERVFVKAQPLRTGSCVCESRKHPTKTRVVGGQIMNWLRDQHLDPGSAKHAVHNWLWIG